jgi:uncharacterized membrane protein (DUF4010 family)
MVANDPTLIGLAVALGGGMLIGIERERRKGTGKGRALAGVRTFALVAVAGAGTQALGQPLLVAIGAALVLVLCGMAYWRNRGTDPGITTEVALLVTYLLGVTAIGKPALSAGGAVVVAVLLAGRDALHRFSVVTLTGPELRDGLLFAAAALVLLPLLPDRSLPWSLGVNPRKLWLLVLVFMGVQAAGYVALRAFGTRAGLALSGLASGFVSSTSTIAALGARAREAPALRAACVAGALFSTVATILLLGIVTLAVLPAALRVLAPSLSAALVVVLALAIASLLLQRGRAVPGRPVGRAFSLPYALGFALTLTAVSALVALAGRHFGNVGAGLTAMVAGAFDVHAAAISTLSRAAEGSLPVESVRLPVLAALATNTVSKVVAAFVGGGLAYGWRTGIGLLLVATAAWLPLWFIG